MKKFDKRIKVNNKYVTIGITAYGKAIKYYENKRRNKNE